MHSAAAAHGFAYDTMRRAEAYRHPLDTQDPLALQHPLAVAASNNEQQVICFQELLSILILKITSLKVDHKKNKFQKIKDTKFPIEKIDAFSAQSETLSALKV
jgi:hypothetical protein